MWSLLHPVECSEYLYSDSLIQA
uniref:Uncharacterized protein n=1 Tax=Arundo donax TaxID=35708 RepID=A0A0A8ZFE2_ARUDO